MSITTNWQHLVSVPFIHQGASCNLILTPIIQQLLPLVKSKGIMIFNVLKLLNLKTLEENYMEANENILLSFNSLQQIFQHNITKRYSVILSYT